MKDDSVDQLLKETRALLCVECGKCASACPMTEIFKDFSYEASPRGIVEKALFGFDILTDVGIWFCLTCDVCTELCPAGVRFRDFVQAVRARAIEEGVTQHGLFCQRCGGFVVPMHTADYIREKVTGPEASAEYLRLCPACRQYDFTEKVKALRPGRSRVIL
ncbi:MAG: 4Fe-4S dicluster domain-containing protein [Anaerolineae bacterium]|nr:4Fe-4S dicluster domain-containing protein [Anaerolineae bacterium]NIN97477.1 4Fe-4S dicluster domain-containing protein [Anaerolineae bacterium]NIQ80406.1 4Fe-4S dicluster domain-containing protein [Anaerolineae bacterium]